MLIDESTGLPGLPEGFFWRVTSGRGSEYCYLQIRRRMLIGSTKCADSIMLKAKVSPSEIRSSARRALEKFDAGGQQHKPFVGDYPPKKLEVPSE